MVMLFVFCLSFICLSSRALRFFFFFCYADHRDLHLLNHSFPTRRSSDLAMVAANRVDTAYDGDALSRSLDAAFSDLFETDCEAVWIPTGTAANSIILAHFARPWQGILCHEEAHIEVDE